MSKDSKHSHEHHAWQVKADNVIATDEGRFVAAARFLDEATFIVEACNSHDALVYALDRITCMPVDNETSRAMVRMARAALTKATGDK